MNINDNEGYKLLVKALVAVDNEVNGNLEVIGSLGYARRGSRGLDSVEFLVVYRVAKLIGERRGGLGLVGVACGKSLGSGLNGVACEGEYLSVLSGKEAFYGKRLLVGSARILKSAVNGNSSLEDVCIIGLVEDNVCLCVEHLYGVAVCLVNCLLVCLYLVQNGVVNGLKIACGGSGEGISKALCEVIVFGEQAL